MSRALKAGGRTGRSGATTKYDANNTVLEKTYGAFADLRRELADSKTAISERTEILNLFAQCHDSQRAWLLLEDYFEKLCLARKDFPSNNWWPRMLESSGRERLEEMAMLFLRAKRTLPTELGPYANLARFCEIEEAEKEQAFVRQIESWLLPPAPVHLDSPRAVLRVLCEVTADSPESGLHQLRVRFLVSRPRTGEKLKNLGELMDLTARSTHEQELFSNQDWEFIAWLSERAQQFSAEAETLSLAGVELLQWLCRWGHLPRFEIQGTHRPLVFLGQLARFTSRLQANSHDLLFQQDLTLPTDATVPLEQAKFFAGEPCLVLVREEIFLLKNPPPPSILPRLVRQPAMPIRKLSHRLLKHLRKNGGEWEQLARAHTAIPQFIFELNEETVRLRLMAKSELDESSWHWNGHEWQCTSKHGSPGDKPEILDDPRLEPATCWLSRLDWFTPEPGLWVGDANENFLNTLATAWPDRPRSSECYGNAAFQRLFLTPRQVRPRIMVQGSGIDWFAVSAQWEAEGMKLTAADLAQLQHATSRFVKLPDSGWIELDVDAVQSAQEKMADMGVDGLSAAPQRVELSQLRQMEERSFDWLQDPAQSELLRKRLSEFSGIPSKDLPSGVQADLRPYQKEGFDFLCHLTEMKLGGVLADDMGLGKTLQTLSWLAWLKENSKRPRPFLVICPASVLHNWGRESKRFTPHFKVLVLESGAARHNLRRQIPQHDLIVTNYALLRRDLTALRKFEFQAIVLDEAQFIKNPSAQVTQSVKQLNAEHRLALTGTPLENRLLDLWSIVDFVEPGYLHGQEDFTETYEPKGADAEWNQRIARRRLSAKLRPILLRRLKRQVAKDLPDRIEERRDCELGDEQRKLYLAELRRSREQVLKAVIEQGLAKSKIHVLAALTRLRQICCHPQLVGSDSPSGKTETLFELLEPLLAEGQKVLVFSQFVQMLNLLQAECKLRQLPTHILTGQTKDRMEVVNAFQNDPNACLFLLSLRAAGTGLNLTTASYVVLYDPWWNPAVEAQAIDRSHRIGQTRTVNAYRLIAPGTVEEKIWELQQRKAQTITDVLGEEGFARALTKTELEYLFSEE